IPTHQLTVPLLREGNFALWTDAHGNGQPFLANPKNAVCYPGTWLYLVLPFFTAFRFHYFLHALIGWLGFFGLLRFFRLCRPPALIGASLFVFSGIFLSNFEFYNHIAAFAWMPWILLFAFSTSFSGFKKTAVLGVLWALQLLSGTPEAVVITLMIIVIQAFFIPGKAGKRMAVALAGLVLGAAISAVQYVPAFETIGRTERAAAETSLWPLEMIQLLNVPFPGILGSDRGPGAADYWSAHLFDKGAPLYYSFYLGSAGLLLILFGFGMKTNRVGRGWRWLFLIFFLMASGRYFPLNPILARIPFLSLIRYPVKYMMGAMFVAAIIAAEFFDDFFFRPKIDFKRVRIGWLTGLGATAVLTALVPSFSRLLGSVFVIRDERLLASIRRSLYEGLAILSVALVLLGAFGLAKKNKGIYAALFALLALADPYIHNRWINPVVPTSFFDPPALLQKIKPPVTVYRQEVLPDDMRVRLGDGRKAQNFIRQSLYPFSGMSSGVRYVFNRDFFGLYPKDARDLREAGSRWPEDLFLKYLRSIGCDYLLGPNPLKALPADKQSIEGFSFFTQKIVPRRGFPYLVRTAIIAETPAEKRAAFAAPDFDPDAAAIVGTPMPGLTGSPGPAADEIVPVLETQGRAIYQVKTAAPAIVVFRGNWAPGWKARVDGKPAPVFEVDLGLKGVFVPQGAGRVEIRYFPGSFILGAAISGAALLVLLGWGLALRIRPRRPGRPCHKPV
ncbi:MAG: hypothetical protein ACYDH3_09670, partial [Candidatus Aminicenantales bacterium]